MKEGEIHPPVRAGQPLPGPGGEGTWRGQNRRENFTHPPADLVSEKRKRIGRLRPLKRHKPAPDHEITTALFDQSRQAGPSCPNRHPNWEIGPIFKTGGGRARLTSPPFDSVHTNRRYFQNRRLVKCRKEN